jgi:hypothetical protein
VRTPRCHLDVQLIGGHRLVTIASALARAGGPSSGARHTGKGRQQQRAGEHRREQPGKIVGDHQQRIDPGRWMKRSGEIHRNHGQPDPGCRRPGVGPGEFQQGEAHDRRHDMTADQRPRLRRLGIRRSDDPHDGGRKRDDDKRIVGGAREPFHGADGDGRLQCLRPNRQRLPSPYRAAPWGGPGSSQAFANPGSSHLDRDPKTKGRQIALPPPLDQP